MKQALDAIIVAIGIVAVLIVNVAYVGACQRVHALCRRTSTSLHSFMARNGYLCFCRLSDHAWRG